MIDMKSIRESEKSAGNPRLSYVVGEGQHGMPVKWASKEQFGLSTRLLRKLKDSEGVWINGRPARLVDRVYRGDRVEICFPKEESGLQAEEIPLDILFEDLDLLVVNKQPGIVVHPTKGHQTGTLLNGILYHMFLSGETYKPRLVNRLDRDTSGIIVIAKNSHSQDSLVKQMSGDDMKKIYLAVVYGLLQQDEGLIDLPIGKEEEHHIHRSVCAHGDPSRTHFRVLERFSSGFSLVQLRLETGRTHQIRVHMSHLGHPVLGDHLYNTLCQEEPDLDRRETSLINRQALHASSLTLLHPVRGVPVAFEAPLPPDFLDLLELLRNTH